MDRRVYLLALLCACAGEPPGADMDGDCAVPVDPVVAETWPPPPPAGDSIYHLVLNVPAFRLDLLLGDSVVRSITVAVGTRQYATRLGAFTITTVTWNPWWNPPPSDWARKDKPTAPGPGNPMGKVKINYSPYYYLHGTPDRTSVGHAASHGCVRLDNDDAIELAVLLQEAGMVSLPGDTQQLLLREWTHTRTLELVAPLGLEVRYDIVEVRDSVLLVHEDIYRLAPKNLAQPAMRALISAGIDSAAIDTIALAVFLAGSPAGGQSPLRDLLWSSATIQ